MEECGSETAAKSDTAGNSSENSSAKQQKGPQEPVLDDDVIVVAGARNMEEGETSIIPNKPPAAFRTSTRQEKKKKLMMVLGAVFLILVAAAVAIGVALAGKDDDDDDDRTSVQNNQVFANPSTVKWRLKGQVIEDPLAIIMTDVPIGVGNVQADDMRSFATAMSIDDGWLAVATDSRAKVHIYRWDNSTSTASQTEMGGWYEHTVLEPSAEVWAAYENETEFGGYDLPFHKPFTEWGSSVALAKHRLVVGAGRRIGSVLTYNYDESLDQWKLFTQPILEAQEDDHTGRSIDLSADGAVMAVGSPRYGIARPLDYTGLIRILEQRNGVSWKVEGQTTGFQSNDRVGATMKLSADGQTLVSGNTIGNTINGIGSGIVWVWRRSNDDDIWNLLGTPLLGSKSGMFFGWDVQVSGDVVAVMALHYKSKTAGVFVYEYVGSKTTAPENTDKEAWKLRGGVIEIEAGFPDFCLTANGSILVTATNAGMGNVTVYQYQSEKWETVGIFEDDSDFIRPNSLEYSLRCSPDGRTIAVGRPTHVDVGAVSVWEAVEEDE